MKDMYMKDELQTKLAEILTTIQNGIGSSADFALEQLPDIAQQYVLYGRVWSTISVLVCLATTALVVWITARFGWVNKQTDEDEAWTEERILVSIFGSFVSVIGAIFFVLALKNAVFIWLAPKAWLLKEVAGLLK